MRNDARTFYGLHPAAVAVAFVDQQGRFHCPCGAEHDRGPVDRSEVYRCLGCGKMYRARGVVELK